MIQQDSAVHPAHGSSAGSYRTSVRAFSALPWALGLLVILCALKLQAQPVTANLVPFTGMSFSGLTGGFGALYLGSTEGAFTLTPTVGAWYQSITYGSPAPSIYDGPSSDPLVGSPGVGVVRLTATGNSSFLFNSLDYSSNYGDTIYDIQGYLGGNLAFEQTGTMAATNTPANFKTLFSSSPSVQVNALLIQLTPIVVAGPVHITSVNLDNINVIVVPEPGAGWLLGFAFAVAFTARRLIPRSAGRPGPQRLRTSARSLIV